MQCLIICTSLLAGKSEKEIGEARVPDSVPDDLRKDVIVRLYSTKVPSTFEGVRITLQIRTCIASRDKSINHKI